MAPARTAHERGNENGAALCEHHLKDIRAELKAKPPPNYLPNLITAAFSAGRSDAPHGALRGRLLGFVGCFSQNEVLTERGQERDGAPSRGRGAASPAGGHEGSSSAHSHHTSPPQRGPPGPEDNLVLSPGMASSQSRAVSPQLHRTSCLPSSRRRF